MILSAISASYSPDAKAAAKANVTTYRLDKLEKDVQTLQWFVRQLTAKAQPDAGAQKSDVVRKKP